MSDSDTESTQTSNQNESVGEIEQEKTSILMGYNLIKVATTTCIYRYAIERIKGAEDETLPWTPIMIVIIKRLNDSFKNKELITEKNLAVIELMLNVPIQLLLEYDDGSILDLEEKGAMDFSGEAFVEPKMMIEWLLENKVIKEDDLR